MLVGLCLPGGCHATQVFWDRRHLFKLCLLRIENTPQNHTIDVQKKSFSFSLKYYLNCRYESVSVVYLYLYPFCVARAEFTLPLLGWWV